MKIEFQINAESQNCMDANVRHANVVSILNKYKDTLMIRDYINLSHLDFGSDITKCVSYSNAFSIRARLNIFYRYRNQLKDDSSCDDILLFEFDSKKIDVEYFCDNILMDMTNSFGGYCSILRSSKFEERMMENFKMVNRRYELNGIYPVMYISEEKIKRYFPSRERFLLDAVEMQSEIFRLDDSGVFWVFKNKLSDEIFDECQEIFNQNRV